MTAFIQQGKNLTVGLLPLSVLAAGTKPVLKSYRKEALSASQTSPQGHVGIAYRAGLEKLFRQPQFPGPVVDFAFAESLGLEFLDHSPAVCQEALDDTSVY